MNLTFFFGPDLEDAACRGHHELFDAQHTNETRDTVNARHTQALRICRRCPALADCTRYANTLTRRQRSESGVLAGRRPHTHITQQEHLEGTQP